VSPRVFGPVFIYFTSHCSQSIVTWFHKLDFSFLIIFVMIRQLAARGRYSAFRKSFSTSTRRNGYEDTIGNLKIGEHTRVIFQGFTGMFEFLTGRFWK
jgi:hypothetical protein